jgi:hypothetical protein
MTSVALWTFWEVATSFLIMGSLAFLRVIKAVPVPVYIDFLPFLVELNGRSQTGSPNRFQVLYKPKL